MTPTPSRDEILACPFCGNAPHVVNAAPIGGAAMIYCRADECLGPSTTAATLQDAMVQWNTRLAVSASDGLKKETPLAKQELPGADRSVSEILNETGLRFAAIALCKRADGDDSRFKHMEPVYMDEARTSVTAYLKAIANPDFQQCNEQSTQGLSRAGGRK